MTLKTSAIAAMAAVFAVGSGGAASADSISDVENARAKDRAGYYTSRQDREKLRRYGRNDGYSWGGGGYGDYGYYDGPSHGGGVSIYVGPRRDYRDDYYD